jgi:molybdopterin-containing oxidoreductase family membrane subunit
MVLFIGAGQILVDLGRPDRMLNVIFYGRYQSPLLWDATSISAYLTASTLYLWLPLIPDLAILRDQLGKRRFFYTVLAMGWTGTERQQKILNRAIGIMAVLVIPIAISVHTVVSFVFSMTIQPAWHSSIFGPYFVAGAIFSGIAALIVAMAIIRRIYRLHAYLKPIHFRYLGYLLLVMTLLWFYLTFAEYLTGYYGNEPEEMKVFWSKFTGPFWPTFWAMVAFNFVVPMILLVRLQHHAVGKTVAASSFIVVGMWLERFNIIVPTLSNPRLPFPATVYWPTWIEWGETVGSFGLFILFYVLFVKFFPIISIWEVREGREVGLREVEDRLRTYLPDETELDPARRHTRVPT